MVPYDLMAGIVGIILVMKNILAGRRVIEMETVLLRGLSDPQ